MGTWIFFISVLFVVIVVALVQRTISNVNQDEQKNDMEELIAQLDDFSVTQSYYGNDNQSGIAIDEKRKKICLFTNNEEDVTFKIYSYRDMLCVEIFEDGNSLTKTSRSSQIGGALLGGLLFGPAGSIIGGLSGITETSNIINKIGLRLVVNDTSSPIHEVNFFEGSVDKSDPEYQTILKNVRHWYGLILVLIKRADDEDKIDEKVVNQSQLGSIADELKKLVDLRNSGVISESEYQVQKTRLMK